MNWSDKNFAEMQAELFGEYDDMIITIKKGKHVCSVAVLKKGFCQVYVFSYRFNQNNKYEYYFIGEYIKQIFIIQNFLLYNGYTIGERYKQKFLPNPAGGALDQDELEMFFLGLRNKK